MKRSIKVKLLFAFLVTTGVICGVLIGCVLYAQVSVEFQQTESRLTKYKSLVCSSVSVESDNLLSAFIFNSMPTISQRHREYFNISLVNILEARESIVIPFHFLSGSKVTFTNPKHRYYTSAFKIYVVKGKSNYDRLVENDFDCSDCSEDVRRIKPLQVVKYSWTFDVTSDYFIVFYNEDRSFVDVIGKLFINRTVYNTVQSIQSCHDVFLCDLDMDLSKPTQFILTHSNRKPADFGYDVSNDVIVINTSCEPRIWMYVLLFIGSPLILATLISFTLKLDREEHVSLHANNERTHLINESNYRPYYSPPPKYEDVLREPSNAPPSYEQTTSVTEQDSLGRVVAADTSINSEGLQTISNGTSINGDT